MVQYNGWVNYPTWAVQSWLENDEYIRAHTLAARNAALHGSHYEQTLWLAEDLSRLWDSLGDDFDVPLPWASLLHQAIAVTDWESIAVWWLDLAADARRDACAY